MESPLKSLLVVEIVWDLLCLVMVAEPSVGVIWPIWKSIFWARLRRKTIIITIDRVLSFLRVLAGSLEAKLMSIGLF